MKGMRAHERGNLKMHRHVYKGVGPLYIKELPLLRQFPEGFGSPDKVRGKEWEEQQEEGQERGREKREKTEKRSFSMINGYCCMSCVSL